MKKSIQINFKDWKILKEKCIKYNKSLDKCISSLLDLDKYYVYKLFLNDGSTYIGQTSNIKSRLNNHLASKQINNIEILCETKTRKEAVNEERKYIMKNKDCLNKNYIMFNFDIKEMGMIHSSIIQYLYYDKFKEIMYVSENGYICKSYLKEFDLSLSKNIKVDKNFIKQVALYDEIDINKIIIKNQEIWYHPTIALDILRECNVDLKIKIYSSLLCDVMRDIDQAANVGIARAIKESN